MRNHSPRVVTFLLADLYFDLVSEFIEQLTLKKVLTRRNNEATIKAFKYKLPSREDIHVTLKIYSGSPYYRKIFHLKCLTMAEAVISAVIGDMVSRAISFVIGHSTGQDSTSAKLQRIRHMLIKIGSVVEEAKGRQITNHGTLEWLSELVNGMYRGRYFLDISNEVSQNLVDVNDNKDVPYRFLLSSFNPAKHSHISASSIKTLFSMMIAFLSSTTYWQICRAYLLV